MLIDSHAHLHFDKFDDDRNSVIERALSVGVENIVTIGTYLESSQAALALAKAHDCIHATAGVHPLAVDRFAASDWQQFESLWQDPQIVGVGRQV